MQRNTCTSSLIKGCTLYSRHTGHNEVGFPFQNPQEIRILPLRPFCFFFCWLRALSGCGSGGGGAPRTESPQLREQHLPQAIGLPPGAPREKVKPIVYPLAAGPAARSKGGHCSTLPRQCCHMGNRRNSNLHPTKSKANNPAWYAESGHFGLAAFNITTDWNRGVILLPLRLIIWGVTNS